MIVLEGPDGGGKTTLLQQVSVEFPGLRRMPRAASPGPDGGPLPPDQLVDWVIRDAASWPLLNLNIYDRHPLISEYIYGPVIRGVIHPYFHTTSLRRYLLKRALVVLCLPPLEAVRASVSADRDMRGVATHVDTIWTLYASLRAQIGYPTLVHYDYTRDDPSQVFHHIRSYFVRSPLNV